jgi:CheY-like chemotaxis protein/HPt (histidine-containing phosphotransfer) domain-containing protein
LILRISITDDEQINLVLSDLNMPEMNGFDLAREIRSIESLESMPIIIISSHGNPGDGKTCRDIGIAGYLTKPISERELRIALESVLGTSLGSETGREFDLVTKYTGTEGDRKEFHILLAEDYPTNQEIAKTHLERAGYHVDVAENGKVAVEAFKRNHYDLILMDIQMPVMDGYQATKSIREIELALAATGFVHSPRTAHRVPIIAMTAHAMQEYKELCLEAGMDDFLSKPLTRKELLAMVAIWVSESSKLASQTGTAFLNPLSEPFLDSPPVIALDPGKPIDLERAIDEFEGDKDLLSEVIAGFTEKVIEQIGSIRAALSCGDAETVRREAHSIKGGAAGLTAGNLSKVAFDLESKGKSEELSGGGEILDDLEREFNVLRRYVEENFTRGVT